MLRVGGGTLLYCLAIALSTQAVSTTPAMATSARIDQVVVLPAGTITQSDEVMLEIRIITGNSAASLYQPTEVIINGTDIQIDVFVAAGDLTALDYIIETASLSLLPEGTFQYTVVVHTDTEDGDTAVGSFVVAPNVPATSTLGLAVMALLVLMAGTIVIRRRQAAA